MPTLTPLLTYITEYTDSLSRIDGERDHMKAIQEKVQTELQIEPKHFAKLATAYHADKVENEHANFATLADLFTLVRGVDAG